MSACAICGATQNLTLVALHVSAPDYADFDDQRYYCPEHAPTEERVQEGLRRFQHDIEFLGVDGAVTVTITKEEK